jgi:hypothetical protein
VQDDSPVIQIIHGIGRFFDSEAPAEISGKPIAFIGDIGHVLGSQGQLFHHPMRRGNRKHLL